MVVYLYLVVMHTFPREKFKKIKIKKNKRNFTKHKTRFVKIICKDFLSVSTYLCMNYLVLNYSVLLTNLHTRELQTTLNNSLLNSHHTTDHCTTAIHKHCSSLSYFFLHTRGRSFLWLARSQLRLSTMHVLVVVPQS